MASVRSISVNWRAPRTRGVASAPSTRPPLCSGSIMLGPYGAVSRLIMRGSVEASATKTASPSRSRSTTALSGGITTPSDLVGRGEETATISRPPSSAGSSTIPASASARRLACSATTVRASSASPPESRAVVTATEPSIHRSRWRAASYRRALPMAMPASVASTRTMCTS